MKAKAIRDLTQLSETDFFAAVAEGLPLIIKNVSRLHEGAVALAASHHYHGCRVLTTIAEEEASKFLILLDAVRCPRLPSDRLSNQLGRFNDHLAKGLYAKACMYRPGTLGQLQEYVDTDRDQFYLDGPNDCDWIFRNEVIQGREGQLYVDYVARDDGHSWSDPAQFSDFLHASPEPASVKIARALYDVGVSTADAIAAVADVWRSVRPNFDAQWAHIRRMNHQTLQLLEERGQLVEQPANTYSWIVHYWQFPMYDLDLSMIEVKLDTLRERQRSWSPEF